ncbi:unnamed protein product [Gadus morhua 'NCC']
MDLQRHEGTHDDLRLAGVAGGCRWSGQLDSACACPQQLPGNVLPSPLPTTGPPPSPATHHGTTIVTVSRRSDLRAPGGPRCPAVRRWMRGCGPQGSAGGPLAWWPVAEGQDWPREKAHLAGA